MRPCLSSWRPTPGKASGVGLPAQTTLSESCSSPRSEVGCDLFDVMRLVGVLGSLAQHVLLGRPARHILTPRHEIPTPQDLRHAPRSFRERFLRPPYPRSSQPKR